MKKEIMKDVYEVGAAHPERRLFDSLIPLPDGTTYNSYVLYGSEKTVLFDTVDPEKTDILLQNLTELGVKKIDYIVTHHAEQDHSGSLPVIMSKFPEAQVLCSAKCRDFLVELLSIDQARIIPVEHDQQISIGGKTLHFMHLPWVHWPETIVTYVPEIKTLFSCDFFGSHYAGQSMFVENEDKIYLSAKRYYAEIMMPFRVNIKKHLEVLKNYQLDFICPSHGPVYKNAKFIIDAYRDWSSDAVKNEVLLPYVSMHESTKIMVEHLAGKLRTAGVVVKIHDLAKSDIGELAMDLVDAATIVVGTPAVLGGAHPLAAYAVFLVNALRPKTKHLSVIGSFGWGAKVVDQLSSMLPLVKAEIFEPVLIKGLPKKNDLELLDKLAATIVAKHNELKNA